METRLKVDDRFTIEMAAPNRERIATLAREGFRSLVDLRAPGEQNEILSPSEEEVVARSHGLAYLNIPVSPDKMNETTARQLEDQVARLPAPVAVHCASGKRAGLFTFMHVARSEGLPGTAAARKAEAMGFNFGTPQARRFFERYVDSGR